MSEVQVPFEFGRRRQQAEPQPPKSYPAQIARTLALAHALQKRVDSGEFADYADMARALGFTRARICQFMDLLLLAPDIQEEILFLEVAPGGHSLTDRGLRRVVATSDWSDQRRRWAAARAH